MLRVRTVFSGVQGAPWLSTAYFSGADTQTGANAAVAAIGAFWGTLDNRIDSRVTWATQVEVSQLDVAGNLTGSFTTTPQTGTGGGAGAPAPIATQGLIVWRTGTFIGGRELKGKTFVPGVTTSDITNGLPNATYLANLNAAAATLNAVTAPDLVIWSRKNSSTSTVSSGTAGVQFAVMRSRRD